MHQITNNLHIKMPAVTTTDHKFIITNNQTKHHAFTLIELLVVMAIISLLIGLLMPALGWARRSSRRAACLANLHQIGLVMTNYINDNNGILPYVLPLDKSEGDESLLDDLADYVTNNAVFICPSDDTGVAEELGTSYE